MTVHIPMQSGKSLSLSKALAASTAILLVCASFSSDAHAQSRGGICSQAGAVATDNEGTGTPYMICDGVNWLVWADLLADGFVTFPYPVSFSTTSAVTLARGTTLQRPTGVDGMMRYNNERGVFEGFQAGTWEDIITSAATGIALPLDVAGEENIMNYGGTTPTATFMRNIDTDSSLAIGRDAGAALADINDATYNVFIGTRAGVFVDTGGSNTFVGDSTGTSATSASSNVFIGRQAGESTTLGSENIFIGANAGSANITGEDNLMIGRYTGRYATAPIGITLLGTYAGENMTTSLGTTAVGYEAGQSNSTDYLTGNYNSLFGYQTGMVLTSGFESTFIGYQAGLANTEGFQNTFVGASAGYSNTTADENTFIGRRAGYTNTIGGNNTFLGMRAGHENLSGQRNVFVGARAGHQNSTSNDNVFVGYYAGHRTTNMGNTFVGTSAGEFASTGGYNTFVGWQAGRSNATDFMTGFGNVALGHDTGAAITSGGGNTLLGTEAGQSLTTGVYNVVVGRGSDANTTLDTESRNILIGYDIETNNTDDYLNIGNTIFGDMGTNPTTPASNDADLTIAGNLTVTGTLNGQSVGQIALPVDVNSEPEIMNYGGDTPTATFMRNIQAEYSMAWGQDAGANLAAGNSHNILIGYNVAHAATDPDYNTIIGHRAAEALTTGSGNSILGWMAGDTLTSGYGNILIGNDAGGSLTTAQNNTMVGAGAGSVSTGSFNVYVGRAAGQDAGSKNTHIGSNAGANSTASDSVFIGEYAGESSGAANETVYIGRHAGHYATAVNNVFVGHEAGMSNGTDYLTGEFNTFVGYQTGMVNTTGEGNTFVGYQAGVANTTGSSNSFVGDFAGYSNTTGSDNTFIGLAAGENSTTGSYKVFIGSGAGNVDVTDNAMGGNTFVGPGAGMANTTGNYNAFFGSSAGGGNVTGELITAIGYQAGANMGTNTYNNTFIGTTSGYNTAGGGNTFLGSRSGYTNTSGEDNTFLGESAGRYASTASSNTFVGKSAGKGTTGNSLTGSGHTALGYHAGYLLRTTAASNTLVGYQAGDSYTTGSGNIMLGYDVDSPTTDPTASYELNIGNALFGDLGDITSMSDGGAELTVDGNLTITGTITGDVAAAIAFPLNVDGETVIMEHGTGGEPVFVNDITNHNVLVGQSAGDIITIGAENTVMGYNADVATNINTYGVAIGAVASAANNAIAVGASSLATDDAVALGYSTTAGNESVAIGYNAGGSGATTGGSFNTSIGYSAGTALASGAGENVLLGWNSGINVTTGDQNTILGAGAAATLDTGSRNIVVGYNVGVASNSVTDYLNIGNTIFGDMGTNAVTMGSHDAAITIDGSLTVEGSVSIPGAMAYMTDGNVALVYDAMGSVVGVGTDRSASGTTAIGANAGNSASLGSVFIGSYAGYNETGANKLYIENSNSSSPLIYGDFGTDAITINGDLTVTGSITGAIAGGVDLPIDVGSSTEIMNYGGETQTATFMRNIAADQSIAIGEDAGLGLLDANNAIENVFVGYQAGKDNATGKWNTFIGAKAGILTSTGSDNTFVGNQTGTKNTSGGSNIFIGSGAGEQNINTSQNTYVGYVAGRYATSARNTFVGNEAGRGISGTPLTGTGNVAMGHLSGAQLQGVAADNTFLGHNAGDATTTGSRNIFLGYGANAPTATTDDYLNIGNTILGDMGTNPTTPGTGDAALNVVGNLRVGTTGTPATTLELNQPTGSFPKLRFSAADITLPNFGASQSIGDVSGSNAFGQMKINRGGGSTATTGGLMIEGFTDSGVNDWTPLALLGMHSGTAPTEPAVIIAGQKWDGVSNRDPLADDEIVLEIQNYYYDDAIISVLGSGNMILHGTGAIQIPAGLDADRPTGVNGMIRYNTTSGAYEGYHGFGWETFSTATGTTLPIDVGGGATEVMNYGGGTPTATFFRHLDTEGSLAIGKDAGASMSTGTYNVFVGDGAGQAGGGESNSFFGYQAGQSNATSGNTFMGYQAGLSTVNGRFNVFVGSSTGQANISGINGTFVGKEAGFNNTTGHNNSFFGYRAGYSNVANSRSTAIGQAALYYADDRTTGQSTYNTAVGYAALSGSTTAANNTGQYNTALGDSAGMNVTSGASNILLGYNTGTSLDSESRNILIGSGADTNNTDDYLNIGNTIYGDMGTNPVTPGSNDADITIAGDLTITGTCVGCGDVVVESVSGAAAPVSILDTGNLSWDEATFAVTGDITYTGTITDVSDRRLKTDIEPLSADDIMAKLEQIQTYSFRMKDDPKRQIEYGVMAQEIEELFPILVKTAKDEIQTKSVNYVGFIAPLIEVSKLLKAENDSLKVELAQVKAQQDDRISKLEQKLDNVVNGSADAYSVCEIFLWVLAAMIGASGMTLLLVGRAQKRKEK